MSVLGAQSAEASVALVTVPQQPLLTATGAGASAVTAISSAGRFVLFTSFAGNLVTNAPNNFGQVFLRDRILGTTTLISATPRGGASNGISTGHFVDDAGQKVVFQSDASNLAAFDENGAADIYMRDMPTGSNILLSASANGMAGNAESRYPIATPDGLYVAFESAASDLVDNDTNEVVDVFVRNIKLGAITRASLLPDGFSAAPRYDNELNGISTNGQYVLFTAYCGVASDANKVARHIFLRDTVNQLTHWISTNMPSMTGNALNAGECAKAVMTPDAKYCLFTTMLTYDNSTTPIGAFTCRHELSTGATTLIATNPAVVTDANAGHLNCALSDDGRFAAYTVSQDKYAMTNQVYRWDFLTGSNLLVSVGTNSIAMGNGTSDSPRISSDGRFVLFATMASDIVTQAVRGQGDLVLRDMDTGITRLVSATQDGLAGAGWNGITAFMAADAKTIAFDSSSGMLVPGDANNEMDVFVRNMDSGAAELISAADPRLRSVTVPGLIASSSLGASPDGRFIVFSSSSDSLAAGDTNMTWDAFVQDTKEGTTRLVTWNKQGAASQNGGCSSSLSISDNGRFVAFDSIATDLNVSDTNAYSDVYTRDMWNATNILVSQNVNGVSGGSPGSFAPLIAPGGEFVLFESKAPNMVKGTTSSSGTQRIYKCDMQYGTNWLVPYPSLSFSSFYQWAILSTSHDRQIAAIGFASAASSAGLGVFDIQSGAWRFYTNSFSGYASLSGDGKRLAYAAKLASPISQLNYFDVGKQTNLAVIPLRGVLLDKICLNHNGSRVAYGVKANPSTNPSWTQVYVWDAATGSNILVSANRDGQPGDGNSKLVGITPDGNGVLFNSQAEDLVTTDHNGWTDVYVRDLLANRTRLLSENRNHTGSGNSLSVASALSADGSSAIFLSTASDLVENDFNATSDVFVVRIADAGEDTDADGMPDEWERLYFTDISHSAYEDADRDGSSNLAEYESGTNPVDSLSVFQISGIVRQADESLRITWTAVPGKSYRLQFKDSLDDLAWNDVAGEIVATGALGQAEPVSSGRNNRYYRVRLVK